MSNNTNTQLIESAFNEVCHDSALESSEVVNSVTVEKHGRFMVASLSVVCGLAQLNVTVLNLQTKLKEYDSVFHDSELIKQILGRRLVPELME